MVLQAYDQQLVTAIVDFCECYMPGMDVMLGLSDILDYFLVVSGDRAAKQQGEGGETSQKLI